MSVHSVTVMAKHVPGLLTDSKVILDLGAGWGRIGHLLLQANKDVTYVVLDLPESMMMSRHRLKQLFPEKQVLDYDELAAMNKITHESLSESPRLVFGGSHHLPKFSDKSIDLFVSINSMQEMDPGDQEQYLDLIENRTEFFYIMAHESPINKIEKTFSSYSWPKSWKQRHYVRAGKMFFYPDFFEAIFQSR